ncbi:MAG: N-acetylmuramoyl-L-alanine amidase [Clostridium sp.]|nr:N-acetylmuramoyl-L-alanine amidase [Clostridium sp.]
MQITNVVCPETKYAIKCPDITDKDGICIHNTYNDASAMSEISYMLGRPEKVSFHVAVDDYRVVTGLPFNRSCFAAGDGRYGKGNAHMINIEICYSKSGGEHFDAAEDLAASYIAYLLKEYGWGIDKVTKHQDYSNKYCPHRTLDLGWERFLKKIESYLEIQNKPIETVEDEGGDLEMARIYQNGSTPENVFADTALTKKIGSLNPRETAEYLSIDNDRPLVRYKVDGTNRYKCGYVKWKGGCK